MLKKSDLESNLERVHEWIKVADQKVSIFLAFQGVVLTILFPNILSWTTQHLKSLPRVNLFCFVTGIVLVGYSIYESVSAIIPRLTKDGKKRSLTYFGDIAKFDLKEFKKAIREIGDEEYENELAEQIHISSKIAVQKHLHFRRAIFAFVGGMLLLALAFLLFKIQYGN